MKSLNRLAFLLVATSAFGVLSSLNAPSAHAWWWSKLDLNSIQGTYNLVIKQDMPLNCPETITVVYNQANATLDSEAFHFSNIGKGPQDGSTSFDPDHAAYSSSSVTTSVNSNSISEVQSDDTTSSDTSQFPLDPGPLDAQPPGSPGSMHLDVSSNDIVTTVKYDSHHQTLTKTVTIGGQDAGEDCSFSRASN